MAIGDETELGGDVVCVEGHGGVRIQARAGESFCEAPVLGSDGLVGLDRLDQLGNDGLNLLQSLGRKVRGLVVEGAEVGGGKGGGGEGRVFVEAVEVELDAVGAVGASVSDLNDRVAVNGLAYA